MNKDVVAEVARGIVAYLAEARRADALARFAVGDLIHAIRYHPSVGTHAVRQVAERLALDESGLRRIARVAERIRPAERPSLLSLTDAQGLPLTWSHIELLERVCGANARIRVARAALEGPLSVHALRRFLRAQETISQSTRRGLLVIDEGPPSE
jgi:hypothetical protein